MTKPASKEIRSTLTSDGYVEISIVTSDKPIPAKNEVLIKVEASPINPSDLGLLLTFAADLDNIKIDGSGDKTVAKIKVHDRLMKAMAQRLDQSMQVGNEGAGIIEDAGFAAKDLIGKTVGVAGGAMYSQYRCVPAKNCLVMDDETDSVEAASSFVNPLTVLAFVETMKLENHTAMVHTAAASNLGQMLVKVCRDGNIPLVNIIRKAAHIDLLKNLGAEYVCNMAEPNFMESLIDALVATGATLCFDATGGGNNGKLPGQILSAMEIAANKTAKQFSRYGSDIHKQVYIYGGLDHSPTILNRSYGMQWGLGGWLLMPMIAKIGSERFQQMRNRVAKEIKTTFFSQYSTEVSFEEMLEPDNIRAYAKQATGGKYLVAPHK
ncbi:MAG: NADH oxidase [Cellvibrionales bacterium TMED148]|nr:NADH oxidase [Porticoccaceae bacterium]RPG93230.1 MAG: NADH oxidase [Cellvibrionales bacterium TMED148]